MPRHIRPSRSTELDDLSVGNQLRHDPLRDGVSSLEPEPWNRWFDGMRKPPFPTIRPHEYTLEDLQDWYTTLHWLSQSRPLKSQLHLPGPKRRITAWKCHKLAQKQQRSLTANSDLFDSSAYKLRNVKFVTLQASSRRLSIDMNRSARSSVEPVPVVPNHSKKLSVGEVSQVSSESSDLSSVPSQIGSLPDDLDDVIDHEHSKKVGVVQADTLIQRPKRQRRPTINKQFCIDHRSESATSKRRKLGASPSHDMPGSPTAVPAPKSALMGSNNNTIVATPFTTGPRASSSRNLKISGKDPLGPTEHSISVALSNLRADPLSTTGSTTQVKQRLKSHQGIELDITNSFFAKTKGHKFVSKHDVRSIDSYLGQFNQRFATNGDFNHAAHKSNTLYPGFDQENPTYYQADGMTKTVSSNTAQPGSNGGSEAPSPTARGTRSNHAPKPAKHHNQRNKHNKGRNGGSGGGRDRDSPEPPNKVALSQEDKGLLAHYRARQAELRKVFSTVAVQQREALELIASRDLTRLIKKQKAHTRVPEYDKTVQQLNEKEDEVKNIIKKELEMQLALADESKRAQMEVIKAQYHNRIRQAQAEHGKGAQGDLVILHKAHRVAGDDTRTDSGSNMECYFPRYHELPEPDSRPRGYSSTRITDEKPFKEHLASYDDQAQRDVIDDDIVGPVVQSVAEQNAVRKAEEEAKARFESLVALAQDRLKANDGYLIPRPLRASENPQFALSRLADCAEFLARAHPEKAYVYMPIAPRDVQSFPWHHLDRPQPPTTQDSGPTNLPTAHIQTAASRKQITQRPKSISVSAKRLVRDDESPSQSSSNTSTPLPPIAPAPSRMPPPPVSSNVHHHHMPQTTVPLTPSYSVPPLLPHSHSRRLSAANSIASQSQASPPLTPTFAQGPAIPLQAPPYPPLASFRSAPPQGHYPPPSHLVPHYAMNGPPMPFPPYYGHTQPAPQYERLPPPPSPSDGISLADSEANRFSAAGNGLPKPRMGGPRREPGQITFTPAQTPDSDRFKPPPQQPPVHPGQALLRPGPTENINGSATGTGKIANTFINAAPDANSRAQQAADLARQNASRNAGQGAGPKGGRRVLLPKSWHGRS